LLKDREEQYEDNLARLIEKVEERIAVHFNWNPKQLTKEEGARQMGLWFSTEGGQCMGGVAISLPTSRIHAGKADYCAAEQHSIFCSDIKM